MFGRVTTLFNLLVESGKAGVKIEAEVLREAEYGPDLPWKPNDLPPGCELISEEAALEILSQLLDVSQSLVTKIPEL